MARGKTRNHNQLFHFHSPYADFLGSNGVYYVRLTVISSNPNYLLGSLRIHGLLLRAQLLPI
jgi:hypothetical protein